MIYVSSSCLKNNRIAQIIDQLAKCGINHIELSGGTDYYDGIESDLQALKQTYNLHYACHAYFPPPQTPFVVNLASCNDQIYRQSIEHYENCITMLRHIECTVLSIHAGFLVEIGAHELGNKIQGSILYDENKAYDRFCCAYAKIEKQCRQNGITLLLENNVLSMENYTQFDHHNYLMMTDYNSIMKMREQMEFNLLLDLAHLHVSSNTLGLSYAKECEKLKEYVKWIHISENKGIVDEHRPLKEKSRILQEFWRLYRPELHVTLESAGSVEEVLESISLLKNNKVYSSEE